jgi:hypothetical protein
MATIQQRVRICLSVTLVLAGALIGSGVTRAAEDPGNASGEAGVRIPQRPQPADLDFFRIKDALSEHVHRLPPDQQDAEKERIRELSNIREYLVKLFKFIPYNSPAGIRLTNGRTAKGSLWGNEKELVLRPPGGRGKAKSLKWTDVAVDQFPVMIEFYVQQRLQHAAPKQGAADTRKKEAAYDYFRAALLADWYGKPALATKYARLAVTCDPDIKPRVENLLPGRLPQDEPATGAP